MPSARDGHGQRQAHRRGDALVPARRDEVHQRDGASQVQGDQMKVYVASSWRNQFQPDVVRALREDGFDVYDFKDADGFSWSEVDTNWQNWPLHIPAYLAGLTHSAAERGFSRDMNALRAADL